MIFELFTMLSFLLLWKETRAFNYYFLGLASKSFIFILIYASFYASIGITVGSSASVSEDNSISK